MPDAAAKEAGTTIRKIDAFSSTAIEQAAAHLRAGRLVAFPTETVYGLGADALNGAAAARIFAAKGRPADNPLIVHVVSDEMLQQVVGAWPEMAERLARAFWPGPLTLVVPRAPGVPDVVTGGLATVAVRHPVHDVARALIRAADRPIAAPSANRSGRPSPTDAAAVLADFDEDENARAGAPHPPGDDTILLLDGGAVPIGVESTVVDCSTAVPTVLRPGGLGLEALRQVCPAVRTAAPKEARRRSPGTRYRHYAPRAPLHLFQGPGARRALVDEFVHARLSGERVGLLATSETIAAVQAMLGAADLSSEAERRSPPIVDAGPQEEPGRYAALVFAALRHFDRDGVARILAEAPPASGLGWAVGERLTRAATAVHHAGNGDHPRRILFVCSGNTCRSPLAAALAQRLAGESGLELEVRSAGLHAQDGLPAAADAVAVGREHGVELAAHASRSVDDDMLRWADLVVTMEGRQAAELVRRFPWARDKVRDWGAAVGGAGDVPDPFGRGPAAYHAAADRLAADLANWLNTFGGAAT